MIYPPDSGILSSLCLRVETADNSWNCSSFCSRKSICKRVGLECLIGAPVDNHDVFFFHCVLSYGLWCFANGTGICIIGWGCVSLFGVTQPTQWIQTMSQCITGYEVPFSSFLGFYHGFTMVLPWFYHGFTMEYQCLHHLPSPRNPSAWCVPGSRVGTSPRRGEGRHEAWPTRPICRCKGEPTCVRVPEQKSTKKSLGMVNDG